MNKMYGLDILRYISSLLFVLLLGFLAFDAYSLQLQKSFEFFLNAIFIIMLFSSGYLFVYNTDTYVKQDSVNYFVNRFKQLVPIYFICTLITYIVSFFMGNTSVGLYNKSVSINITSVIRDFLMIVDIQDRNFIYPIIYHAWPILVEMGILYLVFFYLIFKENHKKRKLTDLYRDVLLFIAFVSILSLSGINQFLALKLVGVPDLIKGIVFFIFNDNLLLLPFGIGILVAIFTKNKVFETIPKSIKTIIGIIFIVYSLYLTYMSFELFFSGANIPRQLNGSPKIYWLLPSIIFLPLGFILLEPIFLSIFKSKKNILQYAYTQFLISDVVVYLSITYILNKLNVFLTFNAKLALLLVLIVFMHFISFFIYRFIDKFVFQNKFFKELPTDLEVDKYVDY